jgi:hypothetical protein
MKEWDGKLEFKNDVAIWRAENLEHSIIGYWRKYYVSVQNTLSDKENTMKPAKFPVRFFLYFICGCSGAIKTFN